MRVSVQRQFLSNGLAVGVVLIVLLILAKFPFLASMPDGCFSIAIILSAKFSWQSGILAVVLSLFSLDYLFIAPVHQWGIADRSGIAQMVILGLVALLVSHLSWRRNCNQQKNTQLSQFYLQNHPEQLQVALSAPRVGLWNWDLLSGTIVWTPEHEALFGLSPGSFDGRYETFDACIHPDDRDKVKQATERARQSHTLYQNEFRVIWSDGTIHWIEGRGQFFYDQKGQAIRMTGRVIDISRRKQAEFALQTTEDKFRQAVLNSPMPIMLHAEDGEVLLINQTWTEITGYSHADIPTTGAWAEKAYGTQKDSALARLNRLYDLQERTAEGECAITTKQGEVRIWEFGAAPLGRIADGRRIVISTALDVTEHRQAEAQLRRSNRAIRTISECNQALVHATDEATLLQDICRIIVEFGGYCTAWIGFAETDAEQRIQLVAQAGCDLDYLNWVQMIWANPSLGQGLTETAIRTGQVSIAPDISSNEQPCYSAALKWGYRSSIALPLVIADRPVGALNIDAAEPNAFDEQEVKLLVELTHDLTYGIRSLQTRTALQHSEQQLQLTLQAARAGSWDLNLLTGKISASNQCKVNFGLPPEAELSYQMLVETRIHSDDRAQMQQLVQQAIQEQKIYEAEYRSIHPDGNIRWIISRGQAYYYDDGTPYRMIGVTLDITERKQIEILLQETKTDLEIRVQERTAELTEVNERLLKALLQQRQTQYMLRDSEAKFRSLSESSPSGVFMTDVWGKVTYTNPRAQEICGYSFDAALQNGWLKWVHPDDLPEFLTWWQTDRTMPQQGIYPEIRFVHANGKICYARVQTAPILNADGDVTAWVGTIEDITESRTIVKMKDEFVSIVSHELRTPLTAIRGSLGLLATGVYDNKSDKKQRMLEIAAQQTDRLVRLVNDILDLQRLESGRMKLTMQACDISALMQQSADIMRASAEENQIELLVFPLQMQVWAAPDAIVQTLTNLLSNAIKFSPPKSQIELSAVCCTPTCSVLLAVKDYGRGIPVDKLEVIFERFQQVDASDSRQRGGTGLGLTICRKIIEQHQGQIWAESIVGEGSTFYFTLPLALNPLPSSLYEQTHPDY
ncbi:MAG TPA: PAS domain S-box protein [Trichocoleus sp.]|jgi:PAS domain S-box-containing protein